MSELPVVTAPVVCPAPASTLVIFGASGDLTKRLLMPALYNLASGKLLDENFKVLGVARSDGGDAEFRAGQADFMKTFGRKSSVDTNDNFDHDAWNWLEQRLHYVAGDFKNPETIKEIRDRVGTGNAVFFLAVPSEYFASIVDSLHAAGLMTQAEGMSRRVIIEKPFGHDLKSAVELNHHLLSLLDEEQIYRIDHFLGKETVQNILALRFSNSIFEPLWNRDHIESVQITAAETVGVEQRGSFYEATGALRDMMPNHMFQLLALAAMEAPKSMAADDIRTEKAKLIESIRPLEAETINENVVRGQYAAGRIANADVVAYVDEPNVARDSAIETYVALKLMVDNWRWAGVPFYIRTGKHMAIRKTEIVVTFKQPPLGLASGAAAANSLLLRLQPDEGIALAFNAKKPGQGFVPEEVNMNFRYTDFFTLKPSTGYESLLYDVLVGNPALYNRADNIEAGWRSIQPILDAAAAGTAKIHLYDAGSEGPEAADEMLAQNGHSWRKLV